MAGARVTVKRTPAARKTPAKAPTKPPAAKATRLPATTTATADTADAVEAAGISVEDSMTAESTPVSPAAGATPVSAPSSDSSVNSNARSGVGRPAAAKAAAAKAAAAKTESAAKAGAARAAATKAAAAKAAAARSAATAAARAATAAAAAARAEAGEDGSDEAADSSAATTAAAGSAGTELAASAPTESVPAEQALAEPVPVQAVPAQSVIAEPAPAESLPAEPLPAEPLPAEPLPAESLPAESVPAESVPSDSVVATSTAPTGAEPERTERRPFWRLNRTSQRQAPAVPAPLVAATASAVAAPAAPLHAEAPAVPAGPAAAVVTPALRIAPVSRKPMAPRPVASAVVSPTATVEIAVSGLHKRFGENVAVDGINLEVRAGSFYGIVGPNGAGKTTTLSMITGLLRPDSGTIHVHGIDVWADPIAAKRATGVLPDRLRLFDRLTGAQLLYYSGVLRGLEAETVRARAADLAAAFGLDSALDRLVADYSAGMAKKIALACAMIHSPRVLVLDEPFESVDPVSAVNVTEILQRYVASGGTVILSSHGMDLIQRVCDHVAIIVRGSVLASGTIDEVRGNASLEERFVDLAGGRKVSEGLEWLHNFSD